MKRKLVMAVLMVLVISFSLASVLLQTNLSLLSGNRILALNFLQRLSGMVVIGLLFCQIILSEKYPKVHAFLGALTLFVIIIHPVLTIYFRYLIKGRLDVFYPFTDMCFLCDPPELIITLGRFAFWFYIAALLGVMLKAYPWFKENWMKVHALVYFAFFYGVSHMFLIGSDAQKPPYLYFFIVLIVVVGFKAVRKLKG